MYLNEHLFRNIDTEIHSHLDAFSLKHAVT
jgi:hypothetical protein